jgi:hypothetical protein
MGEFYAWAVTGQVSRLQLWADSDDRTNGDEFDDDGSLRIANRMVPHQKFVLHSRNGRDTPVHLSDSGVALQNGHVATAAWAARQGAVHGHCIFVQNHTTGASSRLEANLRHVRSEVATGKIVGFGILATLPAALALLAWLFIPGSLTEIDATGFLVGASIALVVLFLVGAIVAKLVFDYLRSEDDEKIWSAVSQALEADARQIERQTTLRLVEPARPARRQS